MCVYALFRCSFKLNNYKLRFLSQMETLDYELGVNKYYFAILYGDIF